MARGQSVCQTIVYEHGLYPLFHWGRFAGALHQADHHVCLGDDEDVLTIGTIGLGPTGVLRLPDVVTIASVGGLWFHHFLHPPRGYDFLAHPCAFVQEQLSEHGHGLGTDVESPTSAGYALGALLPKGIGDAEGVEESCLKELHEGLPRCLLYYGREQV